MKTKILKTVVPAFVLMLAVFGAFAFKNVEDKALLAPETGWINLPGNPCAVTAECDSTVKPVVCTAIYQGTSHQVFGKVNPSMPCSKTLYRLN